MSSSFEFEEIDHLTTGAVGPPGHRVFYLQVGAGGDVVSLRLEKTQVAGLARYLSALLADLPPADELPGSMELVEPVVAEWVVGTLGVSYDEVADRILLVAEELVPDDDIEDLSDSSDGAVARIRATRQQVAALASRGADVVEAGRPNCPLCGQPVDPEGHVCPRLNGHRPRAN